MVVSFIGRENQGTQETTDQSQILVIVLSFFVFIYRFWLLLWYIFKLFSHFKPKYNIIKTTEDFSSTDKSPCNCLPLSGARRHR
jgi:Kef-type K+ transport system membrane component KefB